MNPSPALATGSVAVAPNVRHAFAGVWKLTIARVLSVAHLRTVGILFALLGIVGFAMARAEHGSEGFLGWVVNSFVSLLVPTVAFLAAAGTMRDDFKSGTVDYVLVRPLPRALFVGFKFLAHLVVIEVEMLLATTVLVALALATHAPGFPAAIPSLVLAEAQLVLAFSAFGFLCGVLTSRYVVVGLVYGAVVEVGVGQIPTQLSRLSMIHQARALLQPLLRAAADGAEGAGPSAGTVAATALILLTFSIVCLALAAAVFRLRELTGATES